MVGESIHQPTVVGCRRWSRGTRPHIVLTPHFDQSAALVWGRPAPTIWWRLQIARPHIARTAELHRGAGGPGCTAGANARGCLNVRVRVCVCEATCEWVGWMTSISQCGGSFPFHLQHSLARAIDQSNHPRMRRTVVLGGGGHEGEVDGGQHRHHLDAQPHAPPSDPHRAFGGAVLLLLLAVVVGVVSRGGSWAAAR